MLTYVLLLYCAYHCVYIVMNRELCKGDSVAIQLTTGATPTVPTISSTSAGIYGPSSSSVSAYRPNNSYSSSSSSSAYAQPAQPAAVSSGAGLIEAEIVNVNPLVIKVCVLASQQYYLTLTELLDMQT
jgi:hypothetical protein